MAKISAFKGWRYNTDNISNIEDVIVPPYDVITPEEQEGYYNKSPHNYFLYREHGYLHYLLEIIPINENDNRFDYVQ